MLCRDPDKSHKMCIGGCNERCQRTGKIMNNCNWTAGPWVFNYHDGSVTAGPNTIGYVEVNDWHHLGMGEANAHLIAASPELYEALEMVKQAHIMDICGGFLNSDELNQVSEALAKARGETE